MINGNEVQVYGESDAATAIIQLLENSDTLVNAQFKAPITKNNATGKDRFQASANIKNRDNS